MGTARDRAGADLDARRAEIEARVATLDAEIEQLRADRAVDSADDEHDPEGVTLSTEWSRLVGLRDGAARERAEIVAAEERRTTGTYGVCVDCGRRIPSARMHARPEAQRCVACAEKAGL
ncbi:TraR/DksA family transcriptional regulator [Microbacterium terricola]|uniref:DnaK suppressor protein n=1 Tax=Microbacterium terricola TaxID=344163 RepID=A0ABM8DXP2_9MICO|nr:TraR/DksA C4-type zinc finger protein [Microbacterium terricola]UYK38866.1 TraR/DksA C4-type zinc finger protein [Microbacterium terricola]BDV30438.1 DnaK suppressor protein [Microbacterium terricola]